MTSTIEMGMAIAKPSAKIQAMASEMTGNREELADVEAGEEEEEQGPCGDRTLTTRIAQGIAGASVVMNIVAIAITQSAVMIVAGVIALVIGPIVIMQQFKLQDTGGMRALQNKLRKNVNQLQQENNKLCAENTVLEGEVSKLKECEARLERITAEQGSNVNQLVGLVKENKEIQAKMRKAVEADAVQMLIDTILLSDGDGDNKITEKEIKRLKLRLENLPNIKINEEALKKTAEQNELTISGVFALIKELENTPEEDRIITFL